jgi:hypothetical protein
MAPNKQPVASKRGYVSMRKFQLLCSDMLSHGQRSIILTYFLIFTITTPKSINTAIPIFTLFKPQRSIVMNRIITWEMGLKIIYFNHFLILQVVVRTSIFMNFTHSNYIKVALYLKGLVPIFC